MFLYMTYWVPFRPWIDWPRLAPQRCTFLWAIQGPCHYGWNCSGTRRTSSHLWSNIHDWWNSHDSCCKIESRRKSFAGRRCYDYELANTGYLCYPPCFTYCGVVGMLERPHWGWISSLALCIRPTGKIYETQQWWSSYNMALMKTGYWEKKEKREKKCNFPVSDEVGQQTTSKKYVKYVKSVGESMS